MIKAVIIEDEEIAAERLHGLLHKADREVVVEQVIGTIEGAIKYLSQKRPDLIFLDINLTDELSFHIFKCVKVDVPIIFTTAYSEYALKAFEQFSIDYLLKPIGFEALVKSLEKYKRLTKDRDFDYDRMADAVMQRYQQRFLVKTNRQLKSLNLEEIAYFFSEDKVTFIRDWSGGMAPYDRSLKELELSVDPKLFFRVNKKYLVHHRAIKSMYYVAKAKVKLDLAPSMPQDHIFVAMEKLGRFKKWLSV